MNKEVLKIMTEHLTNERLDKMIAQIKEYQQAEAEENQMSEMFEKIL